MRYYLQLVSGLALGVFPRCVTLIHYRIDQDFHEFRHQSQCNSEDESIVPRKLQLLVSNIWVEALVSLKGAKKAQISLPE